MTDEPLTMMFCVCQRRIPIIKAATPHDPHHAECRDCGAAFEITQTTLLGPPSEVTVRRLTRAPKDEHAGQSSA